MTDIELSWLAGLLEGEGCFHMQLRRGKPTTASIFLCTTDEDVIRKAAAMMNCKVYGPYVYGIPNTHKKPRWQAILLSSKAIALMRLILPHMGTRRSQKILEIISQFEKLSPQAHSHG